jgi:hypothetical protein
MDAALKDGLQQALSQFVLYLEQDFDAIKAMHDNAAEDDGAWALNLALLYLLGKTFPAYYAHPQHQFPDVGHVIRETIRNLATMDR